MSSIENRLANLERKLSAVRGPCPRTQPTCIIEAGQPIPSDALRCDLCGEPHVLEITIVEVG
jgi:hypothetical protein